MGLGIPGGLQEVANRPPTQSTYRPQTFDQTYDGTGGWSAVTRLAEGNPAAVHGPYASGTAARPMPSVVNPNGGGIGGGDFVPGTTPGGINTANAFGTYMNAYGQLYGPELAALQGQQSTALAGLLGLNAAYGMSASALGQGAAADRALLANQAQGTAIQRAAAARQLPYLGRLRGYDMRDINLGRDAANLTADRDRRKTRSDATARGAMITPGFRDDLTDIDRALMNQMLGLNVREERTNTQYDEQEAQARDRMRLLDNEAAAYGIRGQQLEASLNQGLANLNLQNVMSVNDVMDMLASNDVDQALVARNIIESSLGTLNNSLLTGQMPQFPFLQQPQSQQPTIRPRGAQ